MFDRYGQLAWRILPYISAMARVKVYEESVAIARSQAWEQFRHTKMPSESGDAASSFDGEAGQIVRSNESSTMANSGRADNYTLTVFARNPLGEYFLFKSNPKGPYVSHLPQDRAKLVLQADYVAPQ